MNDHEMTDFVFVREQPVNADLAIVFAHASESGMWQRVRRGVELYVDGLYPS